VLRAVQLRSVLHTVGQAVRHALAADVRRHTPEQQRHDISKEGQLTDIERTNVFCHSFASLSTLLCDAANASVTSLS
jgi:hypothetical protein